MAHPTDQLKILSFNVWGLAFVSKDRPVRYRAIAEYLNSPEADYDIVCLQEVWVYTEFESLRDSVVRVLPHSRFYHTGALGSGLAIFSKYPIVQGHALPYSLSGQPNEVIAGDFFVNKAAARATIAHPTFGPLEIWDSHMHAGGEDTDIQQTHRMTQAWQLATEARRGSENGGRAVFVMGDLNSQPYSLPIQLLRLYGGLTDSFLQLHPNADDGPPAGGLSASDAISTLGMTCDSSLNSWSAGKNIPPNIRAQGGKRLDYIFYKQLDPRHGCAIRPVRSQVVLTEPIPGSNMSYSDHFGLTTTFVLDRIEKGSGSSSGDRIGSGSGAGGGNGTGTGTGNGEEAANERASGTSVDPLLDFDDQPGTAARREPSGTSSLPSPTSSMTSAYELTHTPSVGAEAGAIRTTLHTLRTYMSLASRRNARFLSLVPVCIVAILALTVGSAWQPKSWIQPIFTLLAFLLGVAGATGLYIGWVWGRWERGLLDEFVNEMEMRLMVLEGGRRR